MTRTAITKPTSSGPRRADTRSPMTELRLRPVRASRQLAATQRGDITDHVVDDHRRRCGEAEQRHRGESFPRGGVAPTTADTRDSGTATTGIKTARQEMKSTPTADDEAQCPDETGYSRDDASAVVM